jgi:hypothetical protein
LELKTEYLELPGKIFLEDLPIAIDDAIPFEGFRTIVHDCVMRFETEKSLSGGLAM